MNKTRKINLDRIFIGFSLFAMVGMVLCVCIAIFGNGRTVKNLRSEESAVVLNDRMTASENDGSYYFSMVLPDENVAGKTLIYDTAFMDVRIRLDGEQVYALVADKDGFVRANGYNWNRIILTDDDAGKTVEYQITPNYTSVRIKPVGKFYYGTNGAVERRIIGERSLRVIIAVFTLILGIFAKIYFWSVVRKDKEDTDMSLGHLSSFMLMLGVWSLIEAHCLDLYLDYGMLYVFLDHIMLMFMPIPFLLFIMPLYQNQNMFLWKALCNAALVVNVVRMFLQLTGIRELRESLWMTQYFLMLFIAAVIFLNIHEVIKYKISPELKLNIICIVVLMAMTLTETFAYRTQKKGVPISSLGFLFFITVMGINTLKNTRKKMDKIREMEIYRQLAFVDELTGVFNRTAFNQDKANRMLIDKDTKKTAILPTVLYMFDLNDLKKCNDTYGHENGDKYITMVADVLKKVFSMDGKCYRMGGDEFSVMAPFHSVGDIEGKLAQFRRAINEKDKQGFVVPVSVAVGYGIYDESTDKDLDDTMRRADEIMYKDKQEIKRKRAAQNP